MGMMILGVTCVDRCSTRLGSVLIRWRLFTVDETTGAEVEYDDLDSITMTGSVFSISYHYRFNKSFLDVLYMT